MNATEVRRSIETDTDYWNWITGEYIFHDPDFDEPPVREDSSTFGISQLDMESIVRARDNDIVGNGYQSVYDDDIDRDEAAERIATEPGWHPVGVDDYIWIDMARASAGM